MKVLVIDDNDDTRAIARMSLEMLGGFEVVDAASVAAGIAHAVEQTPDVVLLDPDMPDMLGDAAVHALTSQRIPVIVLPLEASMVDWRQRGAIGSIRKPFNPSELARQVVQIMRAAQIPPKSTPQPR
jgi:DNA-binding response OmpR family regulator